MINIIKSVCGSFCKLLTGKENVNDVVYPPPKNLNFGTIFKRKFRWVFSVERDGEVVLDPRFVKVSNRPNIDDNNSIIITYCDVDGDFNNLWNYLREYYDQAENPPNNNDKGILGLYDGVGTIMEEWDLINAIPIEINFGDLDFSATDYFDIEIKITYDEVIHRPVQELNF